MTRIRPASWKLVNSNSKHSNSLSGTGVSERIIRDNTLPTQLCGWRFHRHLPDHAWRPPKPRDRKSNQNRFFTGLLQRSRLDKMLWPQFHVCLHFKKSVLLGCTISSFWYWSRTASQWLLIEFCPLSVTQLSTRKFQIYRIMQMRQTEIGLYAGIFLQDYRKIIY